MKQELKDKAISLRRNGNTYTEIMKVIPVAKSTLSEWLKSVGIVKEVKQIFTEKRRLASLRGGQARRNQRIKLFNQITGDAQREIGRITNRELWLVGAALYWAEGSKEKEYAPGVGIKFSNSDYKMIQLFLVWLQKICMVPKEEIKFEIYIHENYKFNLARIVNFWSEKTNFPVGVFNQIYFKKNKINSKRRNVGDLYYGLLRVRVLGSSSLNRKIQGWVNGILKSWGIV